jgi:gamma-glutamylcyclotransferase (GGCT)/AIG2-like uncharacterized protein YtfP
MAMEGENGRSYKEPSIHPAFNGPSPTASLMQAKFAAAYRSGFKPVEPIPWEPTPYFFYGSLMDPEVLQSVLGLSETPKLQRGTISHFKIKMWGIYPEFVKAEGGIVEGMAWVVHTEEQLQRLQNYETSAYTSSYCIVDLADGGRIDFARTFRWNGDPDSRELEDGTFDILRYQKYFKPSITGKPGASN